MHRITHDEEGLGLAEGFNQLVNFISVLVLTNQDILLCKELLEAGNPPAILPRNSCSDTKNGNLNFGHQEVVPSHTSNVIGRDVGHNIL